MTFLSASQGSVYASRDVTGGRVLLELDHRTGVEKSVVGRGDDSLGQAPAGEDETVDVIFPQTLPGEPGERDAEMATRVAADAAGGLPVEYAGNGTYVVVSYYRKERRPRDEQRPFTQELRVVEAAGGATMHESTIDPDAAGPRYGAFLIMGETLLFVRGQRTLTAVRLRRQ